MVPTPNPVLEKLRERTRELHRQTERALDLPRVVSSLEEYRAVLRCLLGFYEPLERQLFETIPLPGPVTMDWQSRRKAGVLRADLQALEPGDGLAVASCELVPALRSEGERLGAWYVVEGATLGGRIIGAHLAKHLGLTPARGAAFFDVYGGDREERWQQFCGYLADLPPDQAEAACEGAAQVFDVLRQWLALRT